MTSNVLLKVDNLCTYFPVSTGLVKAVDGVNLEIPKGSAVGLVGESACGKSTTALSIVRLVPVPGKIVGGEIIFQDHDVLKLTENQMNDIRGRGISMIFQDPTTFLNPLMRVGDQIAEVLKKHTNMLEKEIEEKVKKTLELVQMPSPEKISQYYPHQLSGGMRQRIIIATAIACDPAFIIADEPTTSLDVTVQAQIVSLIKSLREQLNTSLLLITHDLGLVAALVDVVYVMYAGKIVEKADIFTIFERPKHPYTRGLIESVTSIQEFKKNLVAIKGTPPDMLHPPLGCRFHPRCPLSGKNPKCKKISPPTIEIEKNHTISCWQFS